MQNPIPQSQSTIKSTKKTLRESQQSSQSSLLSSALTNNKNQYFTGNNSGGIHEQYFHMGVDKKPVLAQSKNLRVSVQESTFQKPDINNSPPSTPNHPPATQTHPLISSQAQLKLQKLQAELHSKTNLLEQLSSVHHKNQLLITELEKKVNYYQGRIDVVELDLKRYQECFIRIAKDCDAKAKYKSQVEELVGLFQAMRKQNEIVNGKYEEKCYQLNKLNQKYNKLKSRVKQSSPSPYDNSLKRTKSSSVFKRTYNPLSSTHVTQSTQATNHQNEQRQRQIVIRNLYSKISKIEEQIQSLTKENERLFTELQGKQAIIVKLQKENITLREILDGGSRQKRKTSRSKGKLRLVQKINKKEGQIPLKQPLSAKQKQISQQYYPKMSFNPRSQSKIPAPEPTQKQLSLPQPYFSIIKKIHYNLMNEQITYENLLTTLSDVDNGAEIFTSFPYNLTVPEAETLVNWRNQIVFQLANQKPKGESLRESRQSTTSGQTSKIEQKNSSINNRPASQLIINALQQLLPPFTNISIREQLHHKLNIFNIYQNRQPQLIEQIIRRNTLQYKEAVEYFAKWALKREEIDILLKSYFHETGHIKEVDLEVLGNMIAQWGSI